MLDLTAFSDSMSDTEGPAQAPLFTSHLQDQEVMEGGRVRLDCVIVGHPEPEVRIILQLFDQHGKAIAFFVVNFL